MPVRTSLEVTATVAPYHARSVEAVGPDVGTPHHGIQLLTVSCRSFVLEIEPTPAQPHLALKRVDDPAVSGQRIPECLLDVGGIIRIVHMGC